jgi:hypothetical protein
MKRFTKPWRPRRNIGTQPAGNAACSPRPEVVIAARVIPAPSPRRTFRGKGGADLPTCRPADLPTCRSADLPTCRPADLPTCRPADLPTCRPADLPTCPIWVLDFSDSTKVSPAFNSKAGNFTASFSSRPRLPSHGPAIVRTSSPVLPGGAIFLNFPFPTRNSEQPN